MFADRAPARINRRHNFPVAGALGVQGRYPCASSRRVFSLLAALTPIFIGLDSRSRRLRLARVVELDPDLRLLGHAPVDHCCLRDAGRGDRG